MYLKNARWTLSQKKVDSNRQSNLSPVIISNNFWTVIFIFCSESILMWKLGSPLSKRDRRKSTRKVHHCIPWVPPVYAHKKIIHGNIFKSDFPSFLTPFRFSEAKFSKKNKKFVFAQQQFRKFLKNWFHVLKFRVSVLDIFVFLTSRSVISEKLVSCFRISGFTFRYFCFFWQLGRCFSSISKTNQKLLKSFRKFPSEIFEMLQ